jgi:hypothetical protein
MQECYQTLIATLELSKASIATLFMLVKLCAYAEKYESRF